MVILKPQRVAEESGEW